LLLRRSPRVAIVTNITPNHLDWHNESMQEYIDAKANIVAHQSPGDLAILNAADVNSNGLAARTAARVLRFNGKDAYLKDDRLLLRGHDSEYEICRAGELQIPGRHNIDNVLAAGLSAFSCGISPQVIREVAIHFKGVQHRLQLVRELDGVTYYNDSIATIPEAAVAALDSFPVGKVIQIVGGRQKDLSLAEMCATLATKAKAVLCIGEKGPEIGRAVRAANNAAIVHECGDLTGALRVAKSVAQPGDVVLLSTGCKSYDQFINFEQRGDAFTRLACGN